MTLSFEQPLTLSFEVFTRAHFLKYPCAALQVLDAEAVGAQLVDGVLHVQRYKSLLRRSRWARESVALDRRAGSFALDEEAVDGGEREQVRFAGGQYRKRAEVGCGALRYALVSRAGLLHLRRVAAAVAAGER